MRATGRWMIVGGLIAVVASGCGYEDNIVEGSLEAASSQVNNCAGALDGGYCGYSTMDGFSGLGDAHTIYFCGRRATTSTTRCSNTIIAPPGQADFCSTCGGTVCGTRCCGAGDWCGAGNKCCSGCSPGCPC